MYGKGTEREVALGRDREIDVPEYALPIAPNPFALLASFAVEHLSGPRDLTAKGAKDAKIQRAVRPCSVVI